MTGTRHIVFVGGTSEPGGLHVQTADVAIACAAAGARTSVLCTSINYFSSLLSEQSVGLVTLDPVVPGETVSGTAVARQLKRMAATDAVLCRGQMAATPIRDLVAIRAACRTMYTIEHSAARDEGPTGLRRRLYGLVQRAAVRRTIAVSDDIAREARSGFGLPAGQVAVCRNWYDPAFVPRSRAGRMAMRKAFGIAGDATVIGFHGRLAPEKRIDVLLDAYARLDPSVREGAPLVIIGDGWKRQTLEVQAREAGIAGSVLFAGWQAEVASAVGMVDVFILPSLAEGFPLALMEAMACGAYCIAHPMASTVELIGADGRNGALWPLDRPEFVSAALTAVLALSEPERRTVGAQAAAWISEHHGRDRRIGNVLKALDVAGPVQAVAPNASRRLEFPAP